MNQPSVATAALVNCELGGAAAFNQDFLTMLPPCDADASAVSVVLNGFIGVSHRSIQVE